ncbi:MAG: elongation factor G [Candidatus Omnitrophica bacterium]|nr:elongation factor G [Candidatus Omnitrophota bacterium]MDD5236958.1 elongation factor G [Candidatus Omnitrophota bacterium]MDD5611197.1 elongation factor G [Candidatus Omnitrophota bacterium]
MDVKNKRSVIFLGHAQSGKTSLAEALLFSCYATTRKGATADGSTVSDYSSDEIERKISINASLLHCDYKSTRIQIIDAPGYLDFFGEVIASIRGVDAAILVVDATSGVEVGTEKAWELLESLELPRIIFINKIDKENVNLDKVVTDIKELLSGGAHVLDGLESPELVEAVAESDDKLLEKYLESGSLSNDEVRQGLRQAIVKAKVFPIVSGSALSDKGLTKLLDAVVDYLPSPIERQKVEVQDAMHPENKKELTLGPDAPLAAFVFKSISDPYVGQLTVLRVFSGKLAANTGFYNANKKSKERIGQIFMLQGKEQRTMDEASSGDIVAIAKLKEAQTNDSLCDEKNPVLFEPIVFPEPAISASVKPKTRADEEKISIALHKLTAEDPTFKVLRDAATKEEIISGLGDQHLDVMVHRLKKRFNVDVELGVPKVAYKETVTRAAKVQGKHKKQSGGRGQYGDVWIEIQPLPRDQEFEFVDKIFGGAIPRNFIPSVEKGVRQACTEGAIAGYPVSHIRVILYDGSFHEVDSSDMAFQIAGRKALKKAITEAGPVLLEPIMDVEIIVPEEFMGHITGDLSGRRGRVMGMDVKGRSQIIRAQVPLAEMFKYANILRSITGGRGSYSMKFSHYEEVPQKLAAAIIAQSGFKKEEEEE